MIVHSHHPSKLGFLKEDHGLRLNPGKIIITYLKKNDSKKDFRYGLSGEVQVRGPEFNPSTTKEKRDDKVCI
jgi:hypothetical protein